MNGFINKSYISTVEGSQITFHCGGDSDVMTSTCINGNWIPDPADLDCGVLLSKGIIVAICVLIDPADLDCDEPTSQGWVNLTSNERYACVSNALVSVELCFKFNL